MGTGEVGAVLVLHGEVAEGFVGVEGQVLGQVYLGQRELRGRGLQPGQRVAGPPALRRPGAGVEAGPRVPSLRVHLRGGQRGQRRPADRRAGRHPLLRMAQAQQQLVHGHPGRHTCSAPAPLRNLVHDPRRTLHRGLADGGGSLGPGLNSRGLDTDYIIAISGGCGSVLLLIILTVIAMNMILKRRRRGKEPCRGRKESVQDTYEVGFYPDIKLSKPELVATTGSGDSGVYTWRSVSKKFP